MASFVESTTADVYRLLLADTSPSSDVFAAGLAEEPAAALIDALTAIDDPPTVQFLVTEDFLKWFRRDFHLASTAADMIDAGTLAMRVTDGAVENTILVTDDTVLSLVTTDGHAAGLTTDDEAFVQSMREQCSEAWADAATADLRTPPRSQVYETLTDTFGSDIKADYHAMLDALDTTRSGGYGATNSDDLNEVELAVLVGAKHEVQLFELSKWGEQAGLASKATFSRTKNRLEDEGIITTEKIPTDIGRPRQRLMLGEHLRGYEAGDLPAAVHDELQAAPA